MQKSIKYTTNTTPPWRGIIHGERRNIRWKDLLIIYQTTIQEGFKHVALHEFKSKLTEENLDKYIENYNKEHVTPTEYRKLKMQLDEYSIKDFEERVLSKYKEAK